MGQIEDVTGFVSQMVSDSVTQLFDAAEAIHVIHKQRV
jgi:hypothetical protein